MTGSVGAWKQEDLGFEVSGRLETVIEPGRNIDGRKKFVSSDATAAVASQSSGDLGSAELKSLKEKFSQRLTVANMLEIDGDVDDEIDTLLQALESRLSVTPGDQEDQTTGSRTGDRSSSETVEGSSEAGRIPEPTVLARIDGERFRINVEAAEAALSVAQRNAVSVLTNLRSSNPAQISSARADLKLAVAEKKRTDELVKRQSASEADGDRAEAQYKMALASLESAFAQRKDLLAQLESRIAIVRQETQRLRDAERDLRETELFSAFGGQVASVHAIAGNYVAAGAPVLTVQMMDLVKVELEVSAEESLKFRHGDSVVITTQSETTERKLQGFVHMSDPVADPATRTFTVTLLCRNEQVYDALEDVYVSSSEDRNKVIARTEDIMPMNIGKIIGYSADTMLVGEESIRRDEQGEYILRVDNRNQSDITVSRDGRLEVSKIYIQREEQGVSFLGDWTFFPFQQLPDGDDSNTLILEKDLIVGKLYFGHLQDTSASTETDGSASEEKQPSATESSIGNRPSSEQIVWKDEDTDWEGNEVWFSTPRWLLRPGDLVKVTLPGRATVTNSQYIVPMRTIRKDQNGTAVFVLDQATNKATRVGVVVGETVYDETTDALRIIDVLPADRSRISADSPLIVEGAQFLSDGDSVVDINR